MPIAKLTPNAAIEKKPAEPVVEKSTYQGIVVDHSDTPVESLVAYLDGMPWTVDYYGQMLGKHSDLHELDVGQTPAMQQYQKLIALELRVASTLQSSYDAVNAITSVTGSATIIHVLPNVNDYFVADAGSREQGLFRVKSVERRIFNRDSVYLIDYELVSFVRDDEVKYKDIEAKVVRQYYFSKDRLVEGLSPVLREEEYVASFNISKYYQDTIHRYFRDFFNRSTMLLLVPGQDHEKVYDVFVATFLSAIMDSQEAPELRDMKYVSMDHERYMAQDQLWATLLNRDYGDISRCHQKMVLASRYHFNRSSWLKGPIYWNIDHYVYPVVTDDPTRVVTFDAVPYSGDADLVSGEALMEVEPWLSKNGYQHTSGIIPIIKSVKIDDYYVLSEAFYTDQTNLSVLEILIRDYLKNQTIDLKMLGALVHAYPSWPVLERFYYGPLIILLLKDSLKGFYK